MVTCTPSYIDYCSYVSLTMLALLCLLRIAYILCFFMQLVMSLLLCGSSTSLHLQHTCSYFNLHMLRTAQLDTKYYRGLVERVCLLR